MQSLSTSSQMFALKCNEAHIAELIANKIPTLSLNNKILNHHIHMLVALPCQTYILNKFIEILLTPFVLHINCNHWRVLANNKSIVLNTRQR